MKRAFETKETITLEVKVENEKVRNFYITTVKPMIKPDGSVDTVICISKNITDRKLAEEKLDELVKELYNKSISDGLTEVYNRTYLRELLVKELNRQKEVGGAVSLLMMDIDYFKVCNDTYGHLTGDQVLIQVANRLKTLLTEPAFFGRYGGEEFLAVLPGYHPEQVRQMAVDIRKGIEDTQFEGITTQVTMSIGVAIYEGESVEDFINRADQKLYVAKANGRNCIAG